MKAHITQFFCFILFLFMSIGAQADEFLYRQLSISDGFPPYIQHIYAEENGFVWISVSIRPTTGIKPLYTTIATVTMNLIVSAAIVLLNPYVTIYISYKIPPFALSVHIPDVSTSIYVEVDSKVLLGLPFCDKAFVR